MSNILNGANALADSGEGLGASVEIKHLSKRFTHDGPVIIDDLNLSIRPGEFVALVGASGCGKSTLLNILSGLDTQTSGQVDLGAAPALLFQEHALLPWLTAGKNIELALKLIKYPKSQRKARAQELLELVHLPHAYNLRPHELSGGMRQRVMIAMALALKPEVLIADEPTTALDVTVQREVLELLRDLQAEHGTAILLITHDMGVVAEMADRVVIMRSGRVVETGAVRQIFAAPAQSYTRDLLAAVPRMGQGGSAKPRPETPVVADLREVKVGFDIRGGVLNRVTHRVHAVEGVSFDIRAGETFSLVGESGCGKSTIARAIVGLVPHEGQISIAGQMVGTMTAAMRRRLSTAAQIVFQDPMSSLDPRMTVGDQIAEPLLIHGDEDTESRRARASDLMHKVGLTAAQLDNYPHEFSGGQRQRIGMARALATSPSLVLLDEPTSALDVSVQAQVLNLLIDLQTRLGLTYFFISHDLGVIRYVCDRVALLHRGRIVEEGRTKDLLDRPQSEPARTLVAAMPKMNARLAA